MYDKFIIDNCEFKFDYHCPKRWKNLKDTNYFNERYCTKCNKIVYKCFDSYDIKKHIKLNHCIAIVDEKLKKLQPKLGVILNK